VSLKWNHWAYPTCPGLTESRPSVLLLPQGGPTLGYRQSYSFPYHHFVPHGSNVKGGITRHSATNQALKPVFSGWENVQ